MGATSRSSLAGAIDAWTTLLALSVASHTNLTAADPCPKDTDEAALPNRRVRALKCNGPNSKVQGHFETQPSHSPRHNSL